MKCRGKRDTSVLYNVHEVFCTVSRFPATFHFISRKIDFLRDSVKSTVVKNFNFKFMAPKK